MDTSQSVEVPSSPSASEHVSSMEIGTHGDPRTPLAPPTRPQPVEALLSLWAVAAVERNKRVAAAWRLPHMPARAPETADTRRAFPGRLPVLSCLLDRDPTYIGIGSTTLRCFKILPPVNSYVIIPPGGIIMYGLQEVLF